jgi:hypothetical protein
MRSLAVGSDCFRQTSRLLLAPRTQLGKGGDLASIVTASSEFAHHGFAGEHHAIDSSKDTLAVGHSARDGGGAADSEHLRRGDHRLPMRSPC